jgi:hypothetical protein
MVEHQARGEPALGGPTSSKIPWGYQTWLKLPQKKRATGIIAAMQK